MAAHHRDAADQVVELATQSLISLGWPAMPLHAGSRDVDRLAAGDAQVIRERATGLEILGDLVEALVSG